MAHNVAFLRGMEPDSVADQVASLWSQWDAGKSVWRDRVAEVIQYVYATSTRETSNKSNGWSHSTHVPKLTQIHDNLAANYADALFGGRDWFDFEPGSNADLNAEKRRKIRQYIKGKHDVGGAMDELRKCLNDWVQTGNCFVHVEYVREMVPDMLTGTGLPKVAYEGPRLSRISPYDIVFDFTASSFAKSPKIIRKLMSIADLLTEFEENPGLGWDEAALAKCVSMRHGVSTAKAIQVNKHIQRQYDGFADAHSYFTSGMVEVLEFFGDIYDPHEQKLHRRKKITVVDRRFILGMSEIKTPSGTPLIYHCGWRKRPDNLWAMGPLDNLVGMQYLIDHLENARADAFDKMLTPDRVFVGNVQIEEDGPVSNFYLPDGNGSVSTLAPDATVLQADFQIQVKEAQMEAYAGAPREAMGMRTPGEKTKFEVAQLQNAASRLFQHKIEDFEREFVEPVLNAELTVAVQNLDAVDTIQVTDDQTALIEFADITQEDLYSSGRLKARGASHFKQKAVLIQELATMQQAILADPDLRVHFPAKTLAKLMVDTLGFDQYNLYVPFGRVPEQIEANRLMQAANAQVAQDTSTAMEIV